MPSNSNKRRLKKTNNRLFSQDQSQFQVILKIVIAMKITIVIMMIVIMILMIAIVNNILKFLKNVFFFFNFFNLF